MSKDTEVIESTLNPRQIRFAQEYLVDLNATEAYKRAGYETKDNDVAGANAARLLADDRVKALVDRMKIDRELRTQITADRVLAQVYRLAFADIRGLYGANGEHLPIQQLPDDLAAAIQSVKVSDRRVPNSETGDEFEQVTEYKLVDKKATAEILLKHLGELTEKVEVDVSEGMMQRMLSARARVKK